MKSAILILALILATMAGAQDIQLHGLLLNSYNDTTRITVWSDGALIDHEATTNKHYSIPLGEHKIYTVKFESAGKIKYCILVTNFMELESIQSDVDFRSQNHAIIYMDKKKSNRYTHLIYGVGSTRIIQYSKTRTE